MQILLGIIRALPVHFLLLVYMCVLSFTAHQSIKRRLETWITVSFSIFWDWDIYLHGLNYIFFGIVLYVQPKSSLDNQMIITNGVVMWHSISSHPCPYNKTNNKRRQLICYNGLEGLSVRHVGFMTLYCLVAVKCQEGTWRLQWTCRLPFSLASTVVFSSGWFGYGLW